MIKLRSITPKLRISMVLLFGLLLLPACDKEDFLVKPEFSVNVFEPGPKWPNVKKLTAPQKEVLQKYGRPDTFRLWWNSDGSLKKRDVLDKELKAKKPSQLPQTSWVYINRGTEIVFRGTSYVELPISDEVKITAKYGDPEDVKEDEAGISQWMYYSSGKIYKFSKGHIVEEKSFPAMGQPVR